MKQIVLILALVFSLVSCTKQQSDVLAEKSYHLTFTIEADENVDHFALQVSNDSNTWSDAVNIKPNVLKDYSLDVKLGDYKYYRMKAYTIANTVYYSEIKTFPH